MGMTLFRITISLIVLVFSLLGAAHASPDTGAHPSGHSDERLTRIDHFVQNEVDAGRLPGAVALVIRKGEVIYAKGFGFRDPVARTPLRTDGIFRLYSMTKPITSVAVMILVENGLLRLSDPISDHLPEFADLTVYEPVAPPWSRDPIEQTAVPVKRAPTVWDLLRHASGLTYGQGGSNNQRDYIAAGVINADWTKGLERDSLQGLSMEEASKRMASIPLAFPPGTRWAYGRSTDVLGRLIEVVSGLTLEAFFEERIFRPLAMPDTGFNLSGAQQSRVVESGTKLIDLTKRRSFLSGGGGLAGTAQDYGRFCQMMLNGGNLDGATILSPKSISMMTSDQIGALADEPSFNLGPSYSFGLGVFVREALGPSPVYGSPGEYGWWGGGGTAFWADPEEELCGIWLTQQPDEPRYYSRTFRALVYQALMDSPESD